MVLLNYDRDYRIPFTEHPIVIIQGYGGPYGHHRIRPTTDYTYSVDFALPPGTPVRAAKSGKVFHFNDKANECYQGMDINVGKRCRRLNFIQIQHDDKSIASYLHLEQESVQRLQLEKGQRVNQGDVIARTGLSGWIGPIPNLHFMVHDDIRIRNARGAHCKILKTKPVQFENYNGPLSHIDLPPQHIIRVSF